MLDSVRQYFKQALPPVEFASLRYVEQRHEALHMRQQVLSPPKTHINQGVYLFLVNQQGGSGYAATSDLSTAGIQHAMEHALNWANFSSNKSVLNARQLPRPKHSGQYRSPVNQAWHALSLNDKIAYLNDSSHKLKSHERIVDWQSHLNYRQTHSTLITSDGVEIEQHFDVIAPGLHVIASNQSRSQERSGGGWGIAQQGGLERLLDLKYPDDAARISDEALTLLDAPNCPSGNMDLLLMPSQMMLQIHESIGHPLELDRILGDERNYAGRSFVDLDMFGSYQYGSELLNVSFDPTIPAELASYAYDDEGTPAEKVLLIENGILKHPLGSLSSQQRCKMQGTANARACNWNRPPMDRMANLNLEPGNSSLNDMIGAIEHGVLMDTNSSWSIDDSRNKFQFGCEYGRRIEHGELKEVVRNPNYRGISATFWRNLAMVGNEDTFEIMGTPYCGKGEPNQVIEVGHASPVCVFRQVEVFGGM